MAKRRKDDLFEVGGDDAALGNLFGAFSTRAFMQDLQEYSIMSAGAVGAQVGWGYAWPLAASYLPAGLPAQTGAALKIIAGVLAGQLISKAKIPQAKLLAAGAAVGLVSTGLYSLVSSFAALPALGAADEDDSLLLSGAPIEIEAEGDLSAAPIEVEALAGVGSTLY